MWAPHSDTTNRVEGAVLEVITRKAGLCAQPHALGVGDTHHQRAGAHVELRHRVDKVLNPIRKVERISRREKL